MLGGGQTYSNNALSHFVHHEAYYNNSAFAEWVESDLGCPSCLPACRGGLVWILEEKQVEHILRPQS